MIWKPSSQTTVTTEQTDLSSGQDAAHQVSQKLGAARAGHLQQMMQDPIAALGSAELIRQLSNYLGAYKSGQQLPDQEVIPYSRTSGRSTNTTTSHSYGAS